MTDTRAIISPTLRPLVGSGDYEHAESQRERLVRLARGQEKLLASATLTNAQYDEIHCRAARWHAEAAVYLKLIKEWRKW